MCGQRLHDISLYDADFRMANNFWLGMVWNLKHDKYPWGY